MAGTMIMHYYYFFLIAVLFAVKETFQTKQVALCASILRSQMGRPVH